MVIITFDSGKSCLSRPYSPPAWSGDLHVSLAVFRFGVVGVCVLVLGNEAVIRCPDRPGVRLSVEQDFDVGKVSGLEVCGVCYGDDFQRMADCERKILVVMGCVEDGFGVLVVFVRGYDLEALCFEIFARS